MIATERTGVEMFGQGGYEGFMIFWYAELVGWIVCWKQGVEKGIKSASAYETDVADLHGPIRFSWIWLPQCVSVRRMLDGKLFTVDIVFGHRGGKGKENGQRPLGEVAVTVEDVTVYSRPTRMHPTMIPTQNGTANKRLLRASIKAWPLIATYS